MVLALKDFDFVVAVVQFPSRARLFATYGHTGLPYPSLSPRVWSDSCPLNQ